MTDTVSNEPTPGAMQVAVDFAYKWRSGASHKQLALTLDAFADRRVTEKDSEIAALKAEIDGLREQYRWRPITDDWPARSARHGNYVRAYTEEGALLCPNGGQATHCLLFPAPPFHTIPSKGDDR